MTRGVVRKAMLLVLCAWALSGCLRAGFDAERAGVDGGPPVADGPGGGVDLGLGVSRHGGSADPLWKGAGSGPDTRVGPVGVTLAVLPRFVVKQAKLPSARAWGAAASRGDAVFVIGGATTPQDSGRSEQILSYAPGTDVIAVAGKLTQGLSMFAAVAPADGKVYLVKGLDKDIFYEDRIQRFDPDTGKLEQVSASGLLAANRHAAVATGPLIHIVGGYGTGPMREAIQTYDVTTQKVATSVKASLKTVGPRTRLRAASAPDGTIYLFGGSTKKGSKGSPTVSDAVTNEILAYDPVKQSVTKVASLPVALMNMAVGLLPDGKIYVVGGDTPGDAPGGTTQSDMVYAFDPATATVAAVPGLKLPHGLSGAAFAVHRENRKLYLFGGHTKSGTLSDAVLELYPHVKQGTLRGPVIDTGGSGSSWVELSWDAKTPQGTTVALSVRAADTVFARDASAPAWTTVTKASPVATGLPAGRYLQWRASLSTSSSAVTPVLERVDVTYRRQP